MNQPNEIIEQVRERARAAKHVLQSENGQILLDMLEKECNPTKMIGKTPEETAYNVGKRDVYMYVLELLNREDPEDA